MSTTLQIGEVVALPYNRDQDYDLAIIEKVESILEGVRHKIYAKGIKSNVVVERLDTSVYDVETLKLFIATLTLSDVAIYKKMLKDIQEYKNQHSKE